MSARMLVRLLAVGAMVVAAATCGDTVDPVNEPTPGWVPVRLTSPAAGVGGVLFTVSGAVIDSVRSSQPDRYFKRESATTWSVLIGGTLADGSIVAEILVPDVFALTGYSATLSQVAGRSPFAQRDPGSYALTVAGGL